MADIIPLTGFTPSANPTTPGAVLDCTNMVPTIRGMKSAPSPSLSGIPAFPAAVTGSVACELLSGSYRTIAGTATKLYEVISSNYVDVSGSTYTGGVNRWRFVQFGNATIASNGADVLQQSISSGVFSSIANSPKAAIIEGVQGFVFAFDTTDAINGHRPNGWACSAVYDQTNWTPNVAVQSASGVIIDTPGKITAGRALGTNIVVYKNDSMFYGTYQGPPIIWAFNQISPTIGATCQEAVVAIGTRHIFIGSDAQIYEYDGNSITPIGDDVKEWLSTNWSKQFRDRIESFHDKDNTLIYWYFVSSNSAVAIPDTCIVLNYRTGKFGRADAKIESATSYVSGQITWDSLGSLPGVTTWNTLPQIPYSSNFWASSNKSQSIIDTTHTIKTLAGISTDSSITTGWFGDDNEYSYVQGIIPRFTILPTTCTAIAYHTSTLGGKETQENLGSLYDGEIGADFCGRFIQVTLNLTGNHELIGAVPRLIQAGEI